MILLTKEWVLLLHDRLVEVTRAARELGKKMLKPFYRGSFSQE